MGGRLITVTVNAVLLARFESSNVIVIVHTPTSEKAVGVKVNSWFSASIEIQEGIFGL